MSFPVISTLALALCAAALILLLVRRLTAPGTISECDPEWIANFSIATYRPMLRLLSEDDYKFFTSQPGITPKAVEQFRRERRRVFRSYLRSLVKDFHRLHLAARMTLIYSQQDRPELAQVLFRAACGIHLGRINGRVSIGSPHVRPWTGRRSGTHRSTRRDAYERQRDRACGSIRKLLNPLLHSCEGGPIAALTGFSSVSLSPVSGVEIPSPRP